MCSRVGDVSGHTHTGFFDRLTHTHSSKDLHTPTPLFLTHTAVGFYPQAPGLPRITQRETYSFGERTHTPSQRQAFNKLILS